MSKEELEAAVSSMLGEEDALPYKMMCKECGAKFDLEPGGANPVCPECGSKYIKRQEREGN